MALESEFVPTPYGTFHVESTGRGKPLLIIHGGTASTREWRPVLEPLGKHARCVAIDRLGCGESDRSTRGYDRATITKSLFALADALGFDRFGVMGQSFGSFWSLSMAFAVPERISRLVLVNSFGGPMTDEQIADRRAQMAANRPTASARDTSPAGVEAALDQTIAGIFADPTRVPPTYREDLRWQMERADGDQFGAIAEEVERLGRERYDLLKVPTLVVWGEADTMIPASVGQQTAAAIPGARYAGIPGVGHTCQIEAPDEFVAIVGPFLDETG
jgi:pimeloyl-ACP methyl ester carboxylesterase